MTQVNLPKKSQTGANEWADVQDNDEAIADVVNGELEDDNIAAGAAIAGSKLADGSVAAAKLAGEIPASKLKNEVLKLAVAGTQRKVAFGKAELPASGVVNSAVTVAHGLGTTPVVALATMEGRDVNAACYNLGEATFTLECRDFTGGTIGAGAYAYWIAIG